MMWDVSTSLGLDPVQFRRDNLQRVGNRTHYGQVMKEDDMTVEACLEECIRKSDYYAEKDRVEAFNKEQAVKKRGLALHPFSYGIGIPPMFGQAGALLNVSTDG